MDHRCLAPSLSLPRTRGRGRCGAALLNHVVSCRCSSKQLLNDLVGALQLFLELLRADEVLLKPARLGTMLASCGVTSTSSRAGKYSAFAMISWPSRLRMKSVSSMAACGCLAPLSTVSEPDALGTGSMSCVFTGAPLPALIKG